MITLVKNRGFTLLETMIYIALFGLIMSGAVIGSFNLIESSNHNVTSTGIQEEGAFINRKINWALSIAQSISPDPNGGNTLTIIPRSITNLPSPIVISGATTGLVTIKLGTNTALPLNSDRYPVSNFVFTYTASTNGRPASVAVNFLVVDKAFNFRNYLR